jgi:hypothetical protein
LQRKVKHLTSKIIAFQEVKEVRLGVFELGSVDFRNREAGFDDKTFEMDLFLMAFFMREGEKMQVSGEFLADKFVEEYFVNESLDGRAMDSELAIGLVQEYFFIHESPVFLDMLRDCWDVKVEEDLLFLVGQEGNVKFFVPFSIKLRAAECDVDGGDGLGAAVFKYNFSDSVFALEKLLLATFIDFEFSLGLYNFNNRVERFHLGVDFGEISESELGGHSLENPLKALKLNESSLVGDQPEAEVGFFAGLHNQALVLLIFNRLKVLVPILDQHLKVSDLDVLHEGVVKSETYFNGLFEVTDSRVAVDDEGRE